MAAIASWTVCFTSFKNTSQTVSVCFHKPLFYKQCVSIACKQAHTLHRSRYTHSPAHAHVLTLTHTHTHTASSSGAWLTTENSRRHTLLTRISTFHPVSLKGSHYLTEKAGIRQKGKADFLQDSPSLKNKLKLSYFSQGMIGVSQPFNSPVTR